MRDRPSDTAHRRAAETALRRKLKPGEVVHHRDEDKANNTPTNLEVQSRGAHTRAHNQSRPLSKLRRALGDYRAGRKSY